MDYIHYNPITAKICSYPEQYKYSSAKFYETEDKFGILTHWVALQNFMKQAKISLEYLPIGLRSTVFGAPHSQNPFEHQQRRETPLLY